MIVQAAPIGICILDARTLKAELLNDKFLEIAGKPKEAIIGKWYWEPFAEARAGYEDALNEVVRTGRPYSANETELMLIRHGREEIIFVTFVYAPVPDHEGKVSKVAVWVIENTKQVQERQLQNQLLKARELAEQQQRVYETITSATPDLMYVFDLDYRFTYANSALLAMWGKTWENAIGKNLLENGYEPWHAAMHEREIDQIRITKQPIRGEVAFPHAVLGKRIYDYILNPVLNAQGEVEAIAGTTRDITERKQWEEKLAQSAKELQSINEEMTATNEELAAANEELNLTNEELGLLNDKLRYSNEDIRRLNLRLQESETDFKRLVQLAPVAMMVFRGPDMVIDLVNDAMLEILSKDKSVIGKPLLEGLPEIKGAPAVDMLFEVFNTGKALDGNEAPVPINRDGKTETYYFNFSYRPLFSEGRIIGVMDVAVEVTEQVLARKRLEANEQRLQGILDTMAEGVVIVDPGGKPAYANPMAQRIMGISEDEFRNREYNDEKWKIERLDGSPMPMEEHPMHRVMQTGMPIFDQEIAVVMPSGEKTYISVNAAPLTGNQQEITGAIVSFTDVTNRRLVLQQKEDFISVASHELKTPVTALKASLQLLERMQNDAKPEMSATLITQANRSLNKLTELVDSLLNSNRISQGRFPVHKTTFVIANLVNDCCQHVRNAGVYNIRFEGDTELTVTADEQLIDQVMVNFINNAVKYAPGSHEIIVTAVKEKGATRIAVTDKGPGIAADKVKHIFERYYQAAPGARQFNGLGLGLYISAEIIHKHGGEIGVESTPGNGSTFWFTIPDA